MAAPNKSGTSSAATTTTSPPTKAQVFDHLFKIVLVGDSGVGKSNLLSRFTRDVFSIEDKSTIGVEFATRIITMPDGKRIKAQIWDTAGQERYRAITTAYYRGALGAMLVYDCTREATLDSIPRWLSELREHAHKEISLLMVGNKCDDDLEDSQKQVSAESAESLADELHIKCIETSAKSGLNVEKAFVTVVEQIYANTNALASTAAQPRPASNAVQLNSQQSKQSQIDQLKDKCCT